MLRPRFSFLLSMEFMTHCVRKFALLPAKFISVNVVLKAQFKQKDPDEGRKYAIVWCLLNEIAPVMACRPGPAEFSNSNGTVYDRHSFRERNSSLGQHAADRPFISFLNRRSVNR